MRCAIHVPNFGAYADVRFTAELAREAESAGWDGFFVWDHIHAADRPDAPIADPWVMLTAIALATERVRIGTMVTPVARRRPWKLARETVTLDHLSGGRLILGVGLGHPGDLEYSALGEPADDRIRARRLDEGLDVLAGLWTGESFSYDGTHDAVNEARFLPRPVQRPRIPIWVAQTWPHRRPLERAARWDGVVPMHATEMFPTPEQIEEVVATIRTLRGTDAPFEVNVPVALPDDRSAAATVARRFEVAGATWLQIGAWTVEALRAHIAAGPPV